MVLKPRLEGVVAISGKPSIRRAAMDCSGRTRRRSLASSSCEMEDPRQLIPLGRIMHDGRHAAVSTDSTCPFNRFSVPGNEGEGMTKGLFICADGSVMSPATDTIATRRQRVLARRARWAGEAEDAGFTLVEIMVVLLILAILLAIAIPTFLGVTKSANDRAAQSNLNTAMVNAKAAYHANGQSYGSPSTVNATVLKSAEPSLSFTTTNSANQGQVSVFTAADGKAIVVATFTKSNDCLYQIDDPAGNTAVVPATPFSSATPTGTNGATAMPVAGSSLVFPSTITGIVYVEVKGDTVLADCNASAPVYNGTGYQWSTTGFPSL